MTAAAESMTAPTDAIVTIDDARALLDDLERTAALLSDVIEQESELLAAGQASQIETLQGDKAELSAAYLSAMAQLKRNAAQVKSLVPDELTRIKPMLQEFGAKLIRNQNALAAVLQVSERLIRTAAMKAIATDSGPTTYSADAQVGAAKASSPAATLDRHL